jgi:hypothetical protein
MRAPVSPLTATHAAPRRAGARAAVCARRETAACAPSAALAAALAMGLAVGLAMGLAAGCGDNRTLPPERPLYDAGGPAPLDCVPNLDGRIDARELQAVLDTPVSYLVSPPGATRPVDVAGTVSPAGRRVWDFSVDDASDAVARLSARALAGRWYAGSFPGGQFVSPLDAAGRTEGVYRQEPGALLLLGAARAAPDPPEGRTLLVYRSPVTLYRFPIAPGDAFVSVGEVEGGTLLGLPYAGRDTYEVAVDAAGELRLPDLTFEQAIRVRTKVTVAPAAGAAVVRRQVSFLFECFGEVARVTSRDGETQDDFTVAAEVRRFGL